MSSDEPRVAAAVFLVEDDPNDVFFFERAARRSGREVRLRTVPDGLEAIQHLGTLLDRAGERGETGEPPYRLLVLDLNLPSRSGLEVLEWIRARPELQATPVVILTSSLSDGDVEAAKRLGANDYYIKPAEPRQLAALVKRIFEEWIPEEKSDAVDDSPELRSSRG